MDHYIRLDPGGTDTRGPVDLYTYPQQFERVDLDPVISTTSFGRAVTGKFSEVVSFRWNCMLSEEDYRKAVGLSNWATNQIALGATPEILIYQFFEPYSELASVRTYAYAPDEVGFSGAPTAVLAATTAQQIYFRPHLGVLRMKTLEYGQCYVVEFTFRDSYVIRPSDFGQIP